MWSAIRKAIEGSKQNEKNIRIGLKSSKRCAYYGYISLVIQRESEK